METAVVRLSMPGGVGGQRRKPLPTRLYLIHVSFIMIIFAIYPGSKYFIND